MPYNPIPGLVWSRQNFDPSIIPPLFAKLNLILGKFLENCKILSFLQNYINSLDTELDKNKMNSIVKDLYSEVQDKW